MINESFHGSDIEVIEQKYGVDRNSLIPYASNVNPMGLSPLAKKALSENIDAIVRYPEREYKELRQKISNYCGANPDNIILGSGSSVLIRQVMDTIKPAKTMIICPTYSEYERAAKAVGSEVVKYTLKNSDDFEIDPEMFAKTLDNTFELLVICNPNNPTSQVIDREQMSVILDRCLDLEIFVMVDETYVEFVEDVNKISSIGLTKKYDNLIVIRSISKFFAAPGLRLGYAITANEDYLKAVSDAKIPWDINIYASIAGVMFEDEQYINLTKSIIHTERNLIYSALTSRKTIKVIKPYANFVLIKLLKENQTSTEVFEYCLKKGFMIRDCSDYEGLSDKYVRFCFMKPEQNDNMVNTLLEIV